jgi:hypothetical protein
MGDGHLLIVDLQVQRTSHIVMVITQNFRAELRRSSHRVGPCRS